MFTGIVRTVNPILRIESLKDGRRFLVKYDAEDFSDHEVSLGSSVSVSGVCLTVSDFHDRGLWFDASKETLEKTTLSRYEEKDLVNLEPSLRVGDEIGGHFVFGHVDTVVPVENLTEEGDFYNLVVTLPEDYRRYVSSKGSIALDGISLTVNRIEDHKLYIKIVPHTYQNTRIQSLEPGMNMNLEVDMLARYVYTSVREPDKENPLFHGN